MYALVAAGDVFLSHPVHGHSETGPWRLRGLLDGSGDVFVNAEQAFTRSAAAAQKIVCLKGSPELAGELKQAGVDVVTLANNHAMDFGAGGLADTLDALAAADVACVGAGLSREQSVAPVLRRHGSRTVAFLGVTCSYVPGAAAGADRPGVAAIHVHEKYVADRSITGEAPGMVPFVETAPEWADVERIGAAIAGARSSGADLVVVGVHWGIPYGCVPPILGTLATYQQPLGHALIDAGADVLVGHHAHHVHPIELYRGKPIFYSLGDLLMHRDGAVLTPDAPGPPYDWSSLAQPPEESAIGLVVRMKWAGTGSAATSVELLPVKRQEDGEPGWLAHDEVDRVVELVGGMGVELSSPRRAGDGFVLEVTA